jgi:hypothetical protein
MRLFYYLIALCGIVTSLQCTSCTNKIKQTENFESFLSRFLKDESFKIKRSQTVLVQRYIIDEDQYDTVTLNQSERLSLINLLKDESIRSNNQTSEKVVLEYLGDETGIKITFVFNLTNSYWFLTEIIDSST